MAPHRTLTIVSAISIPLILAAVAVKVSQSVGRPLIDFTNGRITTPLSPSSDFYDSGTASDASNGQNSSAKTGSVPGSPTIPQGPVVSALSYLVGNVATGQVYLQKNPSMILPVASMSKLITAIAATDTLSPDMVIEITQQETDVASDTSKLYAGEKFPVKDLLYPLLLNSSNVAAEALASSSDRTKFLELMSSYSWEVGMPSTFFADPSGIDPRNESTAKDFFALARYLYSSRPDLLAITRTVGLEVATTSDHGGHLFASIHPFVNDPGFIGGKTGHTPEAKDTLLTIMNIGDQPIAIVIIASDGRERDTRLLISRVQSILTGQ